MPYYDYECPICERLFEEQRPVSERNQGECCGVEAQRLISAPHVVVYGTYYDNGLGVEITGPRHRQKVMKVMGVEERGNMTLQECQVEQSRVEKRNMPKCLPGGFLDVYDRVKTQSEGGTLPPGGFDGAHKG